MGKRRLKPGDRVQFNSYDENCKPYKVQGWVKVYVYPHSFHPNGYIEIIDSEGDTIMYGDASDIQKLRD